MSVSDPLLKLLKSHIYNLTISQPVTDKHPNLRPFCELLEIIFRKGLKQSTSLFDFSHKDYWNWLENIRQGIPNGTLCLHPLFDVAIDQVKASSKVTSSQGRGRYFLRMALQNKLLNSTVDVLLKNPNFLYTWYDSFKSFFANDILSEILLSLLRQVSELNFQLCLENHSFLDDTWRIPLYLQLQLVPCSDLGLRLHHTNGRVVVVSLNERGVAADGNQIEAGDVLDEMYGKALRNIVKGTIPKLMKKYRDTPVSLSVVKYKDDDGCTFPPIVELIKMLRREGCKFDEPPPVKPTSKKKPPHALLPEDEEDEVPVHDDNEKIEYEIHYMGKTTVGQDGGVSQVEPAIRRILNDKDQEQESEAVSFGLGETDVVVKKLNSDEVLFKVSYTEISACGRRTDSMQYFAYLAGETTCTLAKQFVAYVFKAKTDDEAKTIICSIAQGFDRTHWFV